MSEIEVHVSMRAKEPQPTGQLERAFLHMKPLDVLYEATVTCPHETHEFASVLCMHEVDDPAVPLTGARVDEQIGAGVARILANFPKVVSCGCGNGYWMRKGPRHSAEPAHKTVVMGNGPDVRYSAN